MSSEWEEFCESKGLNAGSEDDYDRLIDGLDESHQRRRPALSPDDSLPVNLRFVTFREALQWSKCNGGAFTRSADGTHFVPCGKSAGVRAAS